MTPPPTPTWRSRVPIVLTGIAILALLIIGLLQSSDSERSRDRSLTPLTRAQVSRPIPGTPPALAALRRQTNVLRTGGTDDLDTQLRKLRGHPVVVNLWASWCAPCRFELPFFQRQSRTWGTSTAFLGVNVRDNRDDATQLSNRYPMPYPSIEDTDGDIMQRYRVRGLPATAFYDKSGELQLVHQGVFATEQDLEDAIRRYAHAQ